MSEGDLDTVAIIALALREKFGDDASKVAASQLESAGCETEERWRAVLGALTVH